MKTRNWLPAIANDVWTSDVLGRVYDSVGQTDPVTDQLVPYIIKGIDANGNGRFELSEKGAFLKAPCPSPCADDIAWRRNVNAYYDFIGVVFHAGGSHPVPAARVRGHGRWPPRRLGPRDLPVQLGRPREATERSPDG